MARNESYIEIGKVIINRIGKWCCECRASQLWWACHTTETIGVKRYIVAPSYLHYSVKASVKASIDAGLFKITPPHSQQNFSSVRHNNSCCHAIQMMKNNEGGKRAPTDFNNDQNTLAKTLRKNGGIEEDDFVWLIRKIEDFDQCLDGFWIAAQAEIFYKGGGSGVFCSMKIDDDYYFGTNSTGNVDEKIFSIIENLAEEKGREKISAKTATDKEGYMPVYAKSDIKEMKKSEKRTIMPRIACAEVDALSKYVKKNPKKADALLSNASKRLTSIAFNLHSFTEELLTGRTTNRGDVVYEKKTYIMIIPMSACEVCCQWLPQIGARCYTKSR